MPLHLRQALGQPGRPADHHARRRSVAAADGVFPPHSQRVEPGDPRQFVHRLLDPGRRLRHPEATESPGHRVVRINDLAMHGDVRNTVRTAGMLERQGENLRPQRRVRPGIEYQPAVQRLENAVGIAAQPVGDGRRMALRAGQDALLPRIPDLHRPAAALKRGQRQEALHSHAVLAAEAAAQVRCRHPDPVRCQAKSLGQFQPVAERRLR